MIRLAIITCCLATLALGASEEPAQEALTFRGTIVKVNKGQSTVTVEGFWNGAKGKLDFKCPAVAISSKGKNGTGELKDLKKDMPVAVTFHRDLEARVAYADAIVYEPAPKKKKSSGGCGGRRSGGGCPMSKGSRSRSSSGGCPYTSGRSRQKTAPRRRSSQRKSSGGRRCPVTGKRY